MDIVIDTSALLAVIIGEPECDRIVGLTRGNALIGPGSIPWEVGNAFSAMLKQKRLSLTSVRRGLDIFEAVPIRYVSVDLSRALALAERANVYAYDAYILDCAVRHHAPILTLDRPLARAARSLDIELLEV